MKYFANITTAEELKKEFRTLCQTMHPDKGGNADEFKAMLNEYNEITRNFDSIKERQEAEREAARQREEWARREAERKAAEEAEKAKHRPEYLRRCAKWEKLMKEIPTEHKEKKPYFEQTEAEREANAQAAKETTRKRHNVARANILTMCRAAFPGIKFSASYNSHWGGGWVVSWTDGPTAEEVQNKTDLYLFVSGWDTFDGMTDCAGWERAMFTEFAKKYNGRGGKISVSRSISPEVRLRIAEVIKDVIILNERGQIDATTLQYTKLYDVCGITDEESRENIRRRCMACYMHEINTREILNVICENLPAIKPEEKQEAPKFTPKHNAIYKAIKKAMGAHALGSKTQKAGRWYADNEEIKDIYCLIDFAPDCGLFFGNVREYDYTKKWYSFYSSSYANDQKRVARYKAVGIEIKATGEIIAVSPEIVEGLKADRASVEEQRQAWEKAQSEPKAERKTKTATTSATVENVAEGETIAEGDGVQLIATDKGAKLTGNTYNHKDEIKTRGARWYRLGQCWTIKAEQVADFAELVNSWNESAPQAEEEPQSEPETAGKGETLTRSERVRLVAVAKYFGGVEWSVNCIMKDCDTVEILAGDPDVLHLWDKVGRPLNRCACVECFGEDITKEGETLYNISDNRTQYTEDGDHFAEWWQTFTTLHDAEEISETAETWEAWELENIGGTLGEILRHVQKFGFWGSFAESVPTIGAAFTIHRAENAAFILTWWEDGEVNERHTNASGADAESMAEGFTMAHNTEAWGEYLPKCSEGAKYPDYISEPEEPTAEEVPTMSAEDLEALRRLKEENERKEQERAEAVARLAVAFADLCQTLEEVAKAQKAEADKAAKKAAHAQEVQTLRENIATMSAALATMGEQLRKMSDRLAELTDKDSEPTEPQPTAPDEGGKAATGDTLHDAEEISEPADEGDAYEVGAVWQFDRFHGTEYEELHEIRKRSGWFELVVNIYNRYGDGQRFPDKFPTYAAALAALQRFRPGFRVFATPGEESLKKAA